MIIGKVFSKVQEGGRERFARITLVGEGIALALAGLQKFNEVYSETRVNNLKDHARADMKPEMEEWT